MLALASVGVATFGVPAAAATSDPIAGSHASWASAANRVSGAAGTQKITFRVYLRMRDQAGAEATARAVSTPGSAAFRRFLSTAQVRQRYAPTGAAVASVRGWLRGGGFSVGAVPANNMYVEASGTVAQAQRAFGVTLNMYRVRGRVLRAADRELSVPAALGTVVAGVIGVDTAMTLASPNTVGGPGDASASPQARAGTVAPPAGFRNAGPTSGYWAQQVDTTDPAYGGGFPSPLPYAPTGWTPGQLRTAYGIDNLTSFGLDGYGTTVAIIDAFASPTLYQDAAEYARRNDPAHPLRRSQFSQLIFPTNTVNEEPCGAAGWYGEQTLDVEAVHAMAPGARILYVGASDCQDLSLDKALNEVVSRNLAQIVSNSYGNWGEGVPLAEVLLFQAIAIQAVLQGIGVYFASGDNGDQVANLGGAPTPDFSASSPWVTAVGGTSLGIDARGRRAVETGWETGRSVLTSGAWTPGAPGSFLYGSGGGTSRLFGEPWYQRGVVPDALARQNQLGFDRGRVVPDISMVGDPNTGMLVGETQTFPDGVYYDQYRIGGTSLSTPLLAGYVAVADQLLGARHGFINPMLYRFAARNNAIRDVVHQTNAVVRVDYVNGVDNSGGLRTSVRSFDFTGLTIHTTRGYDNVTGLGTPDGAALLFLL
ncbi:MAG TPA: S53 family peptidase [Rugosimonospora sp.]|nr:S53 family peptidase [Rugosimonospora sp.]